MKRLIILAGTIAAVTIVSAVWYTSAQTTAQISDTVTLLPLSANVTPSGLVAPIADFFARADKKPFGIYITPDTSPIKDDHHIGYHTGIDVEFTEIPAQDIEVRAIADGTITYRGWMKGYGGVIVIRHFINGTPLFALYGHMDAATLPALTISQVRAGDRLGVLGDDHSQETDGVRKHLHFSIYAGTTMDYRGYVPAQEDLALWINPLDLYR